LRKYDFTVPVTNEGFLMCEEDEPKRGRRGEEREDGPNILGGTMDWSQETYSVRWPLGLTIRLLAAAKAFAFRVCIRGRSLR
jgi:hypothetical protein